MISQCLKCSKPTSKRAKYCSTQCSSSHRKEQRIEDWLSGKWDGTTKYGLSETLRDFLIEQAGGKCSKPSCGWGEINLFTGRVPVTINHIDGNYLNNRPENLEVICPNCHSLTSNFGNLNKGNGRGYRYEERERLIRPQRSKEEQKAIEAKLAQENLPNENWSHWSLCECGNLKTRSANTCISCYKNTRRNEAGFADLPSNEVMLEGIQAMGYSAYARSIGYTRKQIRSELLQRGADLPDYSNGRITKGYCECGKLLKPGAKACVRHRTGNHTYPPIEEVISGVNRMGFSKYARSLGIEYGSTIRKYLEREGMLGEIKR